MRVRETALGIAFAAACAYGQVQTPPAQPGSASAPGQSDTPAEYAGPAVLTRGAGGIFRLPSTSLRFQPFATFSAVYDQGLVGVTVDPSGKLANVDAYGAEVTAGVTGVQRRRLSLVSLQYSGNYRHYSSNTYYNGSDQYLALTYQRQVRKSLVLTFRESAGTFSRNTFGWGFDGYGTIDPNFAQVPRNEIFDGGVYYSSTMADATYIATPRLSFTAGGDAMLVRRRSAALFGVTGSRARGAVDYRLTRRLTVGGFYDFTHYEFTKSFGASDLHTTGLGFHYKLGPRSDFSAQVGVARIETLGLSRVEVDPVIAALLGSSYAIEAVYRLNYVPIVAVGIGKSFRNGSIQVSGSRSTNPGNGVYLTSRATTGSVGYTYTGLRTWALVGSADYTEYDSLSQNLGKYRWFTASAGVNRALASYLYFTSRIEYRHYNITGTTFLRDGMRVTAGLSFTPSEIPLSLW